MFVVRNITVITNTHAFQPHSVSQYCHQTPIFVLSEKPSVSSVQARKEQEAANYRKNIDYVGFHIQPSTLHCSSYFTKTSFTCPLCLSNRSQKSRGYNFHGNYDQVIYSSDKPQRASCRPETLQHRQFMS